ncbi:alpha/beta fold hydrolase [Roseospira visakhapatnamensis]|uniref:Pimeloyl-ACP methyl ester carboxylesterase n=1 Tax=Roseospira visakhapatnamensis TaxID=390880 RepID=A0A7W6W9C2_9PROT|nr:alpha/beta fold hydrolase [Roseospira visakhapatnamensis]MBB4265955.1 pimeloyl-ACP methyl ester carboxylesterase [Roseospira visakhapatnamensis]
MTETTPLVLLPGLLCDHALWAPQADALADVAAVQVADLTRDDSIGAMARRVLAEAPPGPLALAGLSMGGYVALEIALSAPERVARLALLDTNARADLPEQSERRRGLMEWARDGRFAEVTPALLPVLVHPDRLDDGDLVATVTGMAERVGPEAFVRQQTAILHRADRRGDLGAIACPTLVLCGADDALTPPKVHEEMRDALPAALPMAVVPDCGHLSTLEQPAAVAGHLRAWLNA